MNWPTTLGDWGLIVAAILVTHGLFLFGAHLGFWGTDPNGHIKIG